LTFFAGGAGISIASGANGTVQYNNGGLLGGSNAFTFDAVNGVVTMSNANISNGTFSNLTLSNIANFHVPGGNLGYFMQTNGNGNLSWAAGSLSPGGSNTSIQFNTNGNFDGSANLTFNNVTNVLTVGGNISGNVIIGNYFSGSGTLLSNIQGPNVTGIVGNANYSSYAGNINAATYAIENVQLLGAQTGTYNFDFLSNVIKYSTANAAANLVLNFRGNSTTTANSLIANGQSITSSYVLTTGANVYYVTAVEIDGSAQTIKYAAGASPLPVANSKNSYTFTVIKTSTTPTYDVLGSFTRYS
jgi:hypothetical protein